VLIFFTYAQAVLVEDMGRQELPQLIERKGQVELMLKKQVELPSIVDK